MQLLVVLASVEIHGSEAQAQDCAPNAFCDGMISAATADSLTNGRGNGEVRAGAGWELTPVVTGAFTVGLLLGDARGDKTTRLYATQVTANTVKEFTYDGDWASTSNISLPFYAEGALLLGDGRNKGSAHLYVGEFSGGGSVSEFTWDGAAWMNTPMGVGGQQLLAAADGDPRSDGILHLYFATGSAPPNNVAFEYTFDGLAWQLAPIASPIANVSDGSFGIAVGDGRNDTVERIYEGVFDALAGNVYLYEFSWNGAGWDASQVALIGGGPAAQMMGIVLGDGQNDGINRVYALVRGSGVREFTYDGETWAQTDDIPIGPEVFGIAIGDGQNDLTNRLYIVQYAPSRVTEATFDGAAWQTAEVATLSGNAFRVRVGDGRGDFVNRVYASTSAGVYELTHP
ncbi:MAG TPA: hypothetical protein VKE49_07060 [Myxococcaceae bacterium]|nr:hypothetical protein [Myxococcaceae bacterium]